MTAIRPRFAAFAEGTHPSSTTEAVAVAATLAAAIVWSAPVTAVALAVDSRAHTSSANPRIPDRTSADFGRPGAAACTPATSAFTPATAQRQRSHLQARSPRLEPASSGPTVRSRMLAALAMLSNTRVQ